MTPLLALVLWVAPASTALPAADTPFAIEVIDEETHRGVPLVELRSVNEIRWFTDSNGLAAIDEPGLMGKKVFLHIKSHGYEYPKDGFGYRGKAFELVAGGRATIALKRVNIAERLYRVTGAGIYRDTLILGERAPIAEGLLNAKVFGSDSVINAAYRGRLYWFWGDTNRPEYPLGSFHVPGATSLPPDAGGLDPDRGIDLTYFKDSTGFAAKTAELPGEGPTWLFGMAVIKDGSKSERLFAHYMKVRPPMIVYEHGLAEFDPALERFQRVRVFESGTEHKHFYPGGQTFEARESGKTYVYFTSPFPFTRVLAAVEALSDLKNYESYTCLVPGTRLDQGAVERDPSGKPVYAWKPNTPPTGMIEQEELIKKGKLTREECLLDFKDVDSGKRVLAHSGSVCWNAYLGRYLMIAVETFGSTSLLGEVWIASAKTPTGPWTVAKKIVTHNDYSFYNPKQHPYFDRDGGKIIYFEGTYTHTFSGNQDPTPRYDYNQIMYKLNLADPRLAFLKQ